MPGGTPRPAAGNLPCATDPLCAPVGQTFETVRTSSRLTTAGRNFPDGLIRFMVFGSAWMCAKGVLRAMMAEGTRRSGAWWLRAFAPAVFLAAPPAHSLSADSWSACGPAAAAPPGVVEQVDPTVQVTVELGRSRRLRAGAVIRRMAVADSAVSDVIQVAPREVSVLGKGKGTTHVTIWLEDGDGPRKPIVILVRVVSASQSPQ